MGEVANDSDFLLRFVPAGSGWCELRAIPTDPGARVERAFFQDARLAAGFCEMWEGTHSIYFGVAPRSAEGKGGKKDCRPTPWLIADFDAAHLPPNLPLAHAVDWARTHCESSGVPAPTTIVWSGRGLHLYWLVDSLLDAESFESACRRLIASLGSDPAVKDISRLMRVPGYLNPKEGSTGDCEVLWEGSTEPIPTQLFFSLEAQDSGTAEDANSTYRIEQHYTENRNCGLYMEACQLRSLGRANRPHYFQVLEAVNQSKCRPPLSRDEVRAVGLSALRGDPMPEAASSSTRFGLSEDDGQAFLTDQDLLRMVSRDVSDDCKYVRSGRGDEGEWVSWDEGRAIWAGGYGIEIIAESLLALADELAALDNEDGERTVRRHTTTRNRKSFASAAAGIRGPHQSSPSDFDQHDHILVCSNRVYLDLSAKGGPIAPDRHLYMTKQLSTAYAPGEEAPLWRGFLDRVLPDPAHQAAFGRIAYYCLTGYQSEKAFFVSQGVGQNGKTVAWQVLQGVMGTYARKGNKKLVCPTSSTETSHDASLMATEGIRLSVFEEVKEGDRIRGDLVKEMTGGNQAMSGRSLYQSERQFHFTTKLSVITNQFPEMSIEDPALLNRLVVIPFTQTIAEEEIDPFIAKKILDSEASGVLNWILSWRDEFYRLGVKEVPAEWGEKRDQFVAEADPVVGLVRDGMRYREGASINSNDLRIALQVYSPSFSYPETRSVPKFFETVASWCRSYFDKTRMEVSACKSPSTNMWSLSGVELTGDGEI